MVIAEKAGGKIKYINQRDADYLPAAYMEESYRKQFTDALKNYVRNGKYCDLGADNKISKALLQKIITSIIVDNDYPEALKTEFF